MLKNTGPEVGSIGLSSLSLSGSEKAVSSTEASELICSYNWVEDKHPKILVPGTYETILCTTRRRVRASG